MVESANGAWMPITATFFLPMPAMNSACEVPCSLEFGCVRMR